MKAFKTIPINFFERRCVFLPLAFVVRSLAGRVLLAAAAGCILIAGGSRAAAHSPDSENQAPSLNVAFALAADGAGYPEGGMQAPQKAVPDAPAAQSQADDQSGVQTKRILGIIPNFRAINSDQKLPAQSVKEKFVTATEDSFDYSSIFIPAMLAAYSMGTDATPEFHQGAAGYGRYFWHAAVDQTSENYMVEFFVPALTHEDTRYYTLGRGGFIKRTGYALSRAVVTRSDSGKEVFNLSEVIGAGASSGISTLYYPSRERSLNSTGTEWGLDIGIDALSFVAKEFWPDINHWMFHGSKTGAAASQ